MALDDDIELVNLPEENAEFKVVQLIVRGRPVMLCGSIDALHAHILKEYLRSEGVEYETEPHKKHERVRLPKLVGEEYEVVGMGQAEIYHSMKFFQLPHGYSRDYGIEPCDDFRVRLKQQFEGWEI